MSLLVVLDSDAFLFLRWARLLSIVADSPGLSLVMTHYVAMQELSSVACDVSSLQQAGRLRIEQVKARTSAFGRYKELKQRGADKGEAELIAWSVEAQGSVLFVSNDTNARRHARADGLQAVDGFGLVVRCVENGGLSIDLARELLAPWDDRKQGFGRPKDYRTFDECYAARAEEYRTHQPA